MNYYKTKDDIMAAIFLSLGINLNTTIIDEQRRKVFFVFEISDVEGRALETLIRKNDPRIKVPAGVLCNHLEFVRSWLYLTRLRMKNVSFSEIEEYVKRSRPDLIDESPPTTIKDLADDIFKIAGEIKSKEELIE